MKKCPKYSQKKKISLTINNATPIFKPLCTAKVWLPRYVASLIISLNHKPIQYTNDVIANVTNRLEKKNVCIAKTVVHVRANKQVDVYTGQGLGETKWNRWAWKILLYSYTILLLLIKVKAKNFTASLVISIVAKLMYNYIAFSKPVIPNMYETNTAGYTVDYYYFFETKQH